MRNTAAYDPEELEPPRDLWALNRSDELKLWLQDRENLREQKRKEAAVNARN